jgi:hypothetical protein
MRFVSAVLFLGMTLAPAAMADNVCPCVPISHLWTVKTCADWTCASTELAVSNGDTQVFAVPVGMDDTRWLVVRRVASGSFSDSSDDPFRLEQFDGFGSAALRFSGMSTDLRPIIVTAPDGKVIVMSLRTAEPKRRAVSH